MPRGAVADAPSIEFLPAESWKSQGGRPRKPIPDSIMEGVTNALNSGNVARVDVPSNTVKQLLSYLRLASQRFNPPVRIEKRVEYVDDETSRVSFRVRPRTEDI